MKKVIEVRDLVKEFGDLRAVDRVTFDVEEGEIFGFLGPNGAGKTTTIKILCALLQPTSGTVTLGGIDVLSSPHKIREQIGLVFQSESLDDKLTGTENLRFHGILYNMPRSLITTRINELAEKVGLEDRIEDPIGNYSGGMKRRLELIRGLLHHPHVLFLDEPTLGLDPQTRRKIWEYIADLRRREEISIFLTTHYMDEAEIADRIAIIDKGEIIALDTVEDLKDSLGGDVVTLDTEDNDRAARQIEEEFGLSPEIVDSKLHLTVDNGSGFIPRLIHVLSGGVRSINLHEPTMDDVFLHLTGKEIREADPEPKPPKRRH